MNLGEFIIKIGTQGDTKELDKAIDKLKAAEKETRRQIKLQKELNQATTEHEKALIKENYAQQNKIDKLQDAKNKQNAFNSSMINGIMTAMKMVGAIGATVTMLDRMGNSLLKANQMYMTFGQQTDISISRLRRAAGVARLAGMNMSPEQVAGDISGLQHKIFRFERFGEGAQTFGKLGINPRGMKADQLILSLRSALKGYTGQIKSEYLDELGLSQEWLTVLNLTNEQFKDYLKTADELQLTEEERKELAKYTYQQQKNNMRWELAKQKLLIAIMPMVQQIMEVTSKAALEFSKFINDNPSVLNLIRDVLILFTGAKMISTIRAVNDMVKGLKALGALGLAGGLVKGAAKGTGAVAGAGLLGGIFAKKGFRKFLGKTLGKGAAKFAARQAMAAGVGAGTGGAGLPFAEGALALWGIWEIGKDIFDFLKTKDEKDEEKEKQLTEPVETGTRYAYHTMNSNMTNNFFNNPQPAKETLREMVGIQAQFLARVNR